jgi:hypothetical protein
MQLSQSLFESRSQYKHLPQFIQILSSSTHAFIFRTTPCAEVIYYLSLRINRYVMYLDKHLFAILIIHWYNNFELR